MRTNELLKRIVVMVMVVQLVFGQALFAATSNKDLTLDDGAGDSPSVILTDADDFTLTITKADSGEASIVNNEGTIDFKPSADTDDYLRMLTTGNSSYLYWLGVLSYTNNPGIRVNPTTGELEYRDEDESGWTALDSGGSSATLSGLSDTDFTGTAAGDVVYFDGSNWINLGVGTAGQVLGVNSGATAPEWADGISSTTVNDNSSAAYNISEGGDSYFNINTTDGSEEITFGNTTTNPDYTFEGTGTVTMEGDLTVNGDTILGDNITDTITITAAVTATDGSFIDLASIIHDDAALQGIRLPQANSFTALGSGEGFLAWDMDDNKLQIYDGSAWSDVSATLSGLTDTTLSSPAQGEILYRDGTDWKNLAAGTSGQFLQTQGAAANPVWGDASATLAGMTDTTIAAPASGHIAIYDGTDSWDNKAVSGDIAIDNLGATTIQTDAVDGTDISLASEAQGDVMYFDSTDWVRLAAGTSGQFLQTQGAAANPVWAVVSDKLVRVDTGVLEVATAGVEYYSPDQHGSYFGTVYRQYHGAKVTGNSIAVTGITKLIDFGGIWNNINVYHGLMHDGTATIRILRNTNQIDFVVLGATTLEEGWVDYTK